MTAHVHAALMLLYAQDATTTDKPWELWEWKTSYKTTWDSCTGHPSWHSLINYRRKPERRWYRVAFLSTNKSDSWTVSCDSEEQELLLLKNHRFVRWLTGRVYYDVE